MALSKALMKVGGEIAEAGAKKAGSAIAKEVGDDLLRNALVNIAKEEAIDTAGKGFGKSLLKGFRKKVYNSPAGEAQELVNSFPKLMRTDFGTDANDMIKALKNDGGAVLSGFAKHGGVDTGKGVRRLGISRDSFDKFFKNQQNSFLANPYMELGGSPRTLDLYPNLAPRNAMDVLDDLRNRVLDHYASSGDMNIPNIYGADDYASGLLESIAGSKSPVNTINEFKMALGPRDITSISDMAGGNARQLVDDAVLTLANGETVKVPANSLFGNFDDIKEELFEVPKGMTTDSGYKYAGNALSKEALSEDARGAIYKKLVDDYGPSKTREIMAYYGGDIGKSSKSAKNSFLGRLLTGETVEDPLVMYHGVGTEKLKQMLDIAEKTSSEYAIPNPSLQVINPKVSAGTGYGDVILLGNKSIPGGVDKYSGLADLGGKYNLYSRDIYSPRQVQIDFSKDVPVIAGTRTPATPENISQKMLKGGDIANESNMFSAGAMAATQSKRLKNPLEAIKNSDMLKPEDELRAIIDEWDDEVYGEVQKMLDKYMEKNPDINKYIYGDYIGEELQSAMNGLPYWDDPYGINTEAGRKVVEKLKKKAKNLPTGYFEAKARRAVPLREFGGAILPEGYADERVIKALKDSGIEVVGNYNPDNYAESLQGVLNTLLKGKDRFNTKYMLGLSGLLGLGGLSASGGEEKKTY